MNLFPRAAIGAFFLGSLTSAALFGLVPIHLAGAYLALSGLAYLMYRRDKSAAESGAWRTPENSLLLVGLLGGWPGALIAQQRLRHKTLKQPFQFLFWLTVVANVAATVWLVTSGYATWLVARITG